MNNSDLLTLLEDIEHFLSNIGETDLSCRKNVLEVVFQLKQKMLVLDGALSYEDQHVIKKLFEREVLKCQIDEQEAIEESFRRRQRLSLRERRKRKKAAEPPKPRPKKVKATKKTVPLPPQQSWFSGLSS